MHNQLHLSPFNFKSSTILLAAASLLLSPLSAQEPMTVARQAKSSATAKTEFMRMTRGENRKPRSLETAITRYQSADRETLVDLIAVVHVGEREYYRRLNHQFTQYDAVLYELVAPAGSEVPDLESLKSGTNPLRFLQTSMQRLLRLESQLQHIDYTKKNFIHADLSPAEMQRKMSERGQTAWSLGLQAFQEIMEQQKQAAGNGNSFGSEIGSLNDIFGLMSDPSKLKIMMAEQFTNSGTLDAGLGKTLNQILIDDRNEAAISVLQDMLDRGDRRIAIFYGAAHMPDFEKRLVKQFDLERTRQGWVEAWDLRSTSNGQSSRNDFLSDMLFQLIDELDR